MCIRVATQQSSLHKNLFKFGLILFPFQNYLLDYSIQLKLPELNAEAYQKMAQHQSQNTKRPH